MSNGQSGFIPKNLWTGFTPRGSLARALHDKTLHDQYLSRIDKSQWYQCDLSSIPSSLGDKFVQLGPDGDTIKFLEESEKKSDWILTQIWHMLVKLLLGFFATQTSINGWLQRGSMFVVSQAQLLKLLKISETVHYKSLLDLGAGDGKVTAHLAPIFDEVYVTEMSPSMRNSLQAQGYRVLDVESWHRNRTFNVISCLNLVDRCDTPLDLLGQVKEALKPDGVLLLAVVLPFSAYVESGSKDHKPKQILPVGGDTFEEQVDSFVTEVLTPAGFEVISWSRVPYLCEGDLQQSYYWLDDAIFVLKVKGP
ncbi:protein-L-histidine N-pros-methyltransferase isoform X1 [Euwallacea similis]|uniref:protein-L-histidine N-pros-methyltransferase isoform X1 n=1 Tax=Euwallacea similis TaxID=1736056 RepID=UPI00344F0C4F